MIITVHSVLDKRNNKNIWFGIGQEGYEECMAFLNANITDNYEYFGNDEEINFKWDMNEAEFKHLMTPTDGNTGDDVTAYDGSVFFGDFKLEFLWNDIAGIYNNFFKYGEDGYAWLEDGTPYNECRGCDDDIRAPRRRTFNAFAYNVEQQILHMLNNHPDMISLAIKTTNPNKWYPGEKGYKISDISRDV